METQRPSECDCTQCELERQIEILKAREVNTITAMKSHAEMLNDRIWLALETLKAAKRYDVIPWDGGVRCMPSNDGNEVDVMVVDQVIQILEGVSDGQTK